MSSNKPDKSNTDTQIELLQQQLRESKQDAKHHLTVAESLRDILTILNSSYSLDEILDHICKQASRLANTNAVGIYRFDHDRKVLRIQASIGISTDYASQREVPINQGIVGEAVSKRKILVVPDLAEGLKPMLEATKDQKQKEVTERFLTKYNALLAAPLVVGNKDYGAIALFYPKAREFTDEEIAMVTAFSNQAVLAIENASLRAKTEQTAVEAERNRLARELHDAVTQTLFSASVIAEVLPRLWERDEDEGRRRLEELRTLTRGALAEMRALLLELRPKALAESDMGELLNQLAEATKVAQISTEVTVEGECHLPVDVKIALYRIAQEAMNNIMRHSSATKAAIFLRCPSEQIELEIRDDGKGFDPQRVAGNSLGLGIMRERAQAIGARFDIQSRSGQGTRIKAIWKQKREKE